MNAGAHARRHRHGGRDHDQQRRHLRARSGTPGSTMTIAGNLAFQSGALYLVQVNPSNASSANVTAGGTAALAGTVRRRSHRAAMSRATTPSSRRRAGSAAPRSTALTTEQSPGRLHREPELHGKRRDPQPHRHARATRRTGGLSSNQRNVANALNNFFNNGGALPPAFRERVRPDRRQSRQCALPALGRGRDRRPAGRLPARQPVPRPHARSLRRRPQRLGGDGRGRRIGFAPEREGCRRTSRSPMPR